MPGNNHYKTIYRNDDIEESHKAFHYMRLLEMNDSFAADVDAIRSRYGIEVDKSARVPTDTVEERYSSILSSEEFIDDVRAIARRIKLQGDWMNGLALYICGQPAGATLYPDPDLHRIEARAVIDTDEPHIILKLYGDMTRQELEKATKNIRVFLTKNMEYESVNRLSDNAIKKMRIIRKLLDKKKSYEEIADILDDRGFDFQLYSDVRKQYHEFMGYVERIYQEQLSSIFLE